MQRKEIEKVYIKKINKLKKYDQAYFEHDDPLVPDNHYDDIKQEILNLEKKHNYLGHKNSPSQKIGYKPSDRFKKVDHEIPMLTILPQKSVSRRVVYWLTFMSQSDQPSNIDMDLVIQHIKIPDSAACTKRVQNAFYQIMFTM